MKLLKYKKIFKSNESSVQETAGLLESGYVVIIPTDTVYGFSGIVPATDGEIRKIKGRAETKPFVQLIAEPEDIALVTDLNIPEKLLKKWPGPLTIIVPEKTGNETVAVRCPGDKWLRDVIKKCGSRIYSTSANRSGSPVLYEPSEIEKEFKNEISLFVDDGEKKDALPSTIVKPEKDGSITVIRQGVLTIT